ncbi:DUF4097 family beta strand repeat-containing protein [Sanyastnella coralliicola]|uniref:DUF4097 family beta strand repeat-containing protein n=1 Tax=Sanyastnella coralliicola TaxID=3069118 RepID=UPI0027B8A7E8|nr:DUF4097 family beta strand repeat-containing protein [Longitalea sp. SCSIO 12813]
MKNILSLVLAFVAINAWATKSDFTRNFDESFDVNSDVLIETETAFSTLEIEEWDENTVQVHVEVRIEARNEEQAEDMFDEIDVDIKGDKYRVMVETDMSGNWNNKNNEVEIKIFIKAPDKSKLHVDHSFGTAKIGSFRGDAEVKVAFGSMEVDALTGNEVEIRSEYGEAIINKAHGGEFIVEFGSMEIQEVHGSAEIHNSYSSLEIHNITSAAETIEIDNEFGSVSISVDQGTGYRIEADCEFGDIDLPKDANIHRSVKEITSKEVECTIGSNPKGEIIVNTSFGDVTIDYR